MLLAPLSSSSRKTTMSSSISTKPRVSSISMCLGSLDESAVERSRRVSNFDIIYFDWAYAEPTTYLVSCLLVNVVLKLVSNEDFKSEIMTFISSILAIKSTSAGIPVISGVSLVLFQGYFVVTDLTSGIVYVNIFEINNTTC